MEVIIKQSAEEGCALGAKIIAKLVRKKPDCVLGLATGRTPLRLYEELVRMHREEDLDFSEVKTFNLDEYVGLPPDHEQSYRYFMNENLFRHINIKMENTHVPNGMAEDLKAECLDYERRMQEAGGIDLQLLGIGRNGHIAFNEPTGSLVTRTWIKILSEQTILDNSELFGSLEAMPRHALSVGVGTILEARHCLLLGFGPSKARAIARMIEGPLTSMCPASALQMHSRVTVIADDSSAAGLELLDHYRWIDQHKLDWQQH